MSGITFGEALFLIATAGALVLYFGALWHSDIEPEIDSAAKRAITWIRYVYAGWRNRRAESRRRAVLRSVQLDDGGLKR